MEASWTNLIIYKRSRVQSCYYSIMGFLNPVWHLFYATLSNLATNLSLDAGFGLLASFSVLDPVENRPGVQIDSKYALVLLSSMYGGGPVRLRTTFLSRPLFSKHTNLAN